LPIYDRHFVLSPEQSALTVTEYGAELAAFSEATRKSYDELMTPTQGEYGEVGYEALNTIISAALVAPFVRPEYTCTSAMAKQPREETKFGTNFGGTPGKKKKKKKGASAIDVLGATDDKSKRRGGRRKRSPGSSMGGTGGGSY
jgi:hypothetical protein